MCPNGVTDPRCYPPCAQGFVGLPWVTSVFSIFCLFPLYSSALGLANRLWLSDCPKLSYTSVPAQIHALCYAPSTVSLCICLANCCSSFMTAPGAPILGVFCLSSSGPAALRMHIFHNSHRICISLSVYVCISRTSLWTPHSLGRCPIHHCSFTV